MCSDGLGQKYLKVCLHQALMLLELHANLEGIVVSMCMRSADEEICFLYQLPMLLGYRHP